MYTGVLWSCFPRGNIAISIVLICSADVGSSMESKLEYALPPQTGRGGASAIPPELLLALWNARCEALGNGSHPKFGTLQRFLCTTVYKQYPDLNSSSTQLRVAIQSQLTRPMLGMPPRIHRRPPYHFRRLVNGHGGYIMEPPWIYPL